MNVVFEIAFRPHLSSVSTLSALPLARSVLLYPYRHTVLIIMHVMDSDGSTRPALAFVLCGLSCYAAIYPTVVRKIASDPLGYIGCDSTRSHQGCYASKEAYDKVATVAVAPQVLLGTSERLGRRQTDCLPGGWKRWPTTSTSFIIPETASLPP
jgi:hypothetical protein